MQARFAAVAKILEAHESDVEGELLAAQGKPVDIGGYYNPDPSMTEKAMRPSATLNAIIDGM